MSDTNRTDPPNLPATIDRPALPILADATFDLLGLILSGLKPKSAAGYRKDYAAWMRFTGAETIEAALWGLIRSEPGVADTLVAAWQDEMTKAALAPATIRRRVGALQRALRRARRSRLTTLQIETDLPKVEPYRDTRGPGDGWETMLVIAEAEAARSDIGRRDLAILLLLHDRALRRSEVAGLDLADVELDTQPPSVAIVGKGKHQRQRVTINDDTAAALAAWIAVRGAEPGPLFWRLDRAAIVSDNPRLTDESINNMVRRLGEKAGLPRRTTAHAMRHAGITEALDNGSDIRDVRQFSRHAKLETVAIYDDRRKDLGGTITRRIAEKRRAARERSGTVQA